MTTFFIDLWQDLREKRLWPVAVGLVAACVAVPALLFKPAASPPPQPPLPTATAGPKLPVVSVSNGPSEGSKLLAFSERNPFRPLSDLPTTGGSAAPNQSSPSGSGSSTSPSSGSTPPASSSSPSGSGPSPSSSPSSSSNPSPLPSLVPPSTTPTVHWFRWAADFKFGTPGQLKTKTALPTLSLLPSNQQPVITFMGATNDGGSAVIFIADPTYTASGQGHCNVTGYACRFVTLTPTANSETFTSADGNTKFKIQLVRIYKQNFTPKNSTDQPLVHAAASDRVDSLDMQQLVPALLSLVGGGQVVGSDATAQH